MASKRTLWSLTSSLEILVLTLFLSIAPGLAPSEAAAQTDAARGNAALSVRGKFIDQRIAEFMEKNDVPGMTMAIVQAPYIPRSAGYGRASLADDELASTKTMWNIGPLTQGFTTVAIFQLHEAQKLDLRDTIGQISADSAGGLGQDDGLPAPAARLRHSRLPDQPGLQGRPGLQARRSDRVVVGQAAPVRARYPGPA